MAELATVARPYAEALFRVAREGDLNAWSELVAEMAQAAAHPDVLALAQNPNVSDADMGALFVALLKSPVPAQAKNFIDMLVENRRIALMTEIGAQFHALKNASEGAADAVITSAFPMGDSQVTELIASLEKKFGRKLNPSVIVDAALIGGVRVEVGDQVLDTSVRAKLQQMQVALLA